MASRFFRSATDSESESESSDNESFISDEELSSDEEEFESDDDLKKDDQPKKNRFLKGGSDSDEDSEDEEGGRRQIKSQKDKRYEEMESCVKSIENGEKNNDWTLISNEFDRLNKLMTKAQAGINGIVTPKFYIKCLVDLEDFLQEAGQKEKAAKKKMNANNAKAMNAMKQKLKKNNKAHEDKMAQYRKDPDSLEEPAAPIVTKVSKKKSAFLADSDSEDESAAASTSAAQEVDDGFTTVGKGGKAVVEITSENLLQKLREVLEARGKKSTDRNEQIAILQRLLKDASSPYQKIKVLLTLISSRFDANLSMSGYMQVELWRSVEKEINQLLQIFETNKQFYVHENADDFDDEDKDVVPEAGKPVAIRGSLISFVERLDDEFTKSLQSIDPHTTDYIDRMRDEATLYAILVRSQVYFESYNLNASVGRVIMRRLEHVYFKPEQVISQIEISTKKLLPPNIASSIITAEDPAELTHQLCTFLYQQDVSVLRTRAMLCHIYHHALHQRFHVARDMLLMSHLQETIHQADVPTQILYNRVMVQLGLCAFRDGLIKESHACLQEIQGSGRPKELLAQGVQMQRYGQPIAAEQEQLERQRQLPFHMHINLELLECVYHTCSMLLEIPAQAQAGPNNKKVISKTFRRLLDYNERQAFLGPPENIRDHIMGAAKALASGEWEKSRELIMAIKIWDLMPNTQHIKDMLARKIQEEGLRTYLFTYASYYSTIGLAQLSKMFDLSIVHVSSIAAKMIWQEELSASLDQVTQCVVLHQVEQSRVQQLALQFADKAVNLVEQNERLLEQKNAEQRPEQQQQQKDRRGNKGQQGNQQNRNAVSGQRTFQQRTGGRNNFNNVFGNAVRGGRTQSARR
ncbi:Translation initiation factor 3 subunit c [Umbelopsis sp. WA50703]